MALQVWLPLDGSLENKGLDNLTVTNNGASVNAQGKIGSCYSFDGNSELVTSSLDTSTWDNYSISCWIKADPSISDGTWHRIGGVGNHNFFQLDMNTTDYVRLFVSVTGATTGIAVTGTMSIVDGLWHHLAGTADDSKISLYIDGELIRSTDRTGIYHPNSAVARVGSVNSGNKFVGLVNDFRIYDHALSVKEVKEISKGLIAHYPLNDKVGLPNLLRNTAFSKTNVTTYWNDEGGFGIYAQDGELVIPYKSGNGRIYYNYNSYRIPEGDYVLSFDVRANGVTQLRCGRNNIDISQTVDVTENRKHYSIQITGGSALVFGWQVGNPTHTADVDVFLSHIKLEEGTIATPWIPKETDEEYAVLGLDENIIYDCSGYGHNLTSTSGSEANIEVDPDTPRYRIATSFNRVSKYGAYVFTGKTFTIALWLKQNALYSWARYVALKYSSNDYIGFCDGNTEASVGFHIYKDVDGTRTVIRDGYISGWTTGEWFHAAAVVDGTKCIFYKDGEARSTVTMQYEPSELTRLLTLNAFGDNNTSSGDHAMSDVRIYATALSAEDIKELYETSASVDQNGSTWAYELVEE